MDFRSKKGEGVNLPFLGGHIIMNNLAWQVNTANVTTNAQQRFLLPESPQEKLHLSKTFDVLPSMIY